MNYILVVSMCYTGGFINNDSITKDRCVGFAGYEIKSIT